MLGMYFSGSIVYFSVTLILLPETTLCDMFFLFVITPCIMKQEVASTSSVQFSSHLTIVGQAKATHHASTDTHTHTHTHV